MKFIFQTENLDERFYKRFIHTYAHWTLNKKIKIKYKTQLDNLTWIIRSSTMASEDRLFHGKDGVGGVTSHTQIIVYIEDKQENIYDMVQRVFRQNNEVICHEFGHWILLTMGLTHKVPLRNDDYSGVKAGKMLNFNYAEVHDRDIEDFKFIMRFHFIDWKKLKLIRKQFRVLDFRDIIASA